MKGRIMKYHKMDIDVMLAHSTHWTRQYGPFQIQFQKAWDYASSEWAPVKCQFPCEEGFDNAGFQEELDKWLNILFTGLWSYDITHAEFEEEGNAILFLKEVKEEKEEDSIGCPDCGRICCSTCGACEACGPTCCGDGPWDA